MNKMMNHITNTGIYHQRLVENREVGQFTVSQLSWYQTEVFYVYVALQFLIQQNSILSRHYVLTSTYPFVSAKLHSRDSNSVFTSCLPFGNV